MSRIHISRSGLALVALICALALMVAGCNAPAKDAVPAAGSGGTEPAPVGPGPSMLASASFTDPFDGSYGVPATINAAVVAESNYEEQWGPTSKPNPTASEAGGVLTIADVTQYKGYDSSMLNAAQGTFEMLYTPAADILEVMKAENQPSWQKFSTYDPPTNGMLLDTIGWRAAPTASYGIVAGYTEETATVSWGIWDGSAWHMVSGNVTGWQDRAMRITASYGPAGVLLFLDGEKVAEDTTYTGGIDMAQPFTLGQAPWYWPYGPHSTPGEISEFKYDVTQVSAK